MTACARCQRSENGADWSTRGDWVTFGLALCFNHGSEFTADLDRLMTLGSDDPEYAHAVVDNLLAKWAPRPLAEAAAGALSRQPWIASA